VGRVEDDGSEVDCGRNNATGAVKRGQSPSNPTSVSPTFYSGSSTRFQPGTMRMEMDAHRGVTQDRLCGCVVATDVIAAKGCAARPYSG
jgi:hypothetical protein